MVGPRRELGPCICDTPRGAKTARRTSTGNSIRRGRKVTQETVAQLGELDAQGRARATALAREITGRIAERSQGHLFETDAPVEAAKVRLDAVRLERSRSFGAAWLGWALWRALKFDELLGGLLPRGREAVAWAEVIAILVIGRLCEPSSELHVAEQWYRTTALEDLLNVGARAHLRRAAVSGAGSAAAAQGGH